ncbi:HAMP domain-containing sensor histidine kinase [Paenibacillus elgii]|uniref:HAMP domain-containing sensor histidine kinase n=1 Tax=Paenibacillus elgii TaxID=189691 RepID=UPI000248D872|nr:HAMP domain-containing sensor histidine kinase [Paenibacillus elgii]
MGKIKKKLRNISIRKSFVIYMAVFLLFAILLSGLITKTVDIASESIKSSYSPKEAGRYYLTTENGKRLGNGADIVIQYETVQYSPQDKRALFVLDILRSISVPFSFAMCIGAAAMLFYRNKLRIPLAVLNTASEKIAADDLDFSVEYNSKDEMGRLCTSFEKMRGVLEKNNREMWRSMEERKRLNAAFAHDLRTPLTVLRGYSEFLSTHLAADTVSKEKVLSTVHTMRGQIGRLESYVQNISAIQRLEEIQPQPKMVALSDVQQAFQEISDIVREDKKVCFAPLTQKSEMISIDLGLALQVFENLMSNAVRYAKEKIDIVILTDNHLLKVTVYDDGKGFSSEALKNATQPFYRADNKRDKLHFGLGLYICKILCEKHGGSLLLSNVSTKGACITAVFHYGNSFSKIDKKLIVE